MNFKCKICQYPTNKSICLPCQDVMSWKNLKLEIRDIIRHVVRITVGRNRKYAYLKLKNGDICLSDHNFVKLEHIGFKIIGIYSYCSTMTLEYRKKIPL